MRVDPLDDGKTKRFRSAVGSANLLISADRRDIQYATKELARRMSTPRECDWTAVTFGRLYAVPSARHSSHLHGQAR